MLARVQVEHEIDQRPFKSRSGAIQDRETGPRNLRRAFEIQNAERCPEVNMIFWIEIKLRLRAPPTNFDVRGFVFANRNAFVWDVGQHLQNFPHLGLGFIPSAITLGDIFL